MNGWSVAPKIQFIRLHPDGFTYKIKRTRVMLLLCDVEKVKLKVHSNANLAYYDLFYRHEEVKNYFYFQGSETISYRGRYLLLRVSSEWLRKSVRLYGNGDLEIW